MQKELLKEAETVEKAVELAAAELGIDAGKLTVEVLQEPQKKAFGLFGGSNARVRVTYQEQEAPAQAATEFLKKLLEQMGVADVTITAKEEDNRCTLTLEGEDLGFIIGRRGETLDALQYLVSLTANRVQSAYYRVSLDIGNYREKRENTLSSLAHRNAVRAAKTGRKISLEPMNPYERRIIHTAVQEVKGATSWSVGTEPNRHVVIGPSDDNPIKERNSTRNNRRDEHRETGETVGNGENREKRERRESGKRGARGEYVIERPVREVRKFIPRSEPAHDAEDFVPPERTESETEKTATLYGRIDL